MEAAEIVSQSTTIAVQDDNGDSDVKRIDANVTSNVESRFENSPEFETETSMEFVDSIVAYTASMTKENVEVFINTDEKDVETVFESPLKIKVSNTVASKIQDAQNYHQTDRNCIVPKEIKKTTLSNDETDGNVAVGMESSVQVIDASTNETSSVALFSCVESTTMGTHNSSMDEATVDTDSVNHDTSLVNIEVEESQIEKGLETQSILSNEQSGGILEASATSSSTIGEHTESAAIMENNLSISKDKYEKSVNLQITKKVQVQAAVTSLSVIATAYDTSDSESEEPDCICEEENNRTDENEKEVQITKEYRNMTIIETSDEDSDSDDSSSAAESSLSSDTDSDKSNDSSENDKRTNDSKKKNERNRRQKGSHEKELKGEFDNLPPIEDLKISVPEVLCDPLGEVGWMVEQMVVVRPKPGKPTLNLDTMLFVERGRRVLGRIFDVFGQVSEPHYCVRFNSTEHIKESDIKVGMTVYFCPNTEYTSVVFLQDLLKMKVTDELGDDEQPEFSDDEEERAYFAALKQKQKNEKAKSGGEVPQKRQRMAAQGPTWKSNHPWSSSRMQQQPGKTYNTPDWSDSSPQNACHPTNLWHYPSAYPNNPWSTTPEPYQGNAWPTACPQNAYGYSEQFGNRHPRPNARPFFRPPQSFQSGHNPYAQNRPYAQQSNSARYPGANFPWRSQSPRQPGMTWSLPPPPPPPPPGM